MVIPQRRSARAMSLGPFAVDVEHGAVMALNISAWSIRSPIPSIVLSFILLVLGWTSFLKLPVTRLPNVDIPIVSVIVTQFGAAPSELESQVTKTIEDGVSGVEGVRHILSSITDGISVTTIEFRLETNTDRALNDVKDAVTRVRSDLPRNVNEPLVERVELGRSSNSDLRRHLAGENSRTTLLVCGRHRKTLVVGTTRRRPG